MSDIVARLAARAALKEPPMTDTTPGGWPDASKPGWLPDKGTRRRHWLQFHPRLDARLFWWWPKQQHWAPAEDGWKEEEIAPDQMAKWRYLGPLLLPSEVSALVAKEREACAATAEREMRELFGDADEYQQGWNAGLEAGAAAIRARGDATKDIGRLNDCGGSDSCCQGPCKARY